MAFLQAGMLTVMIAILGVLVRIVVSWTELKETVKELSAGLTRIEQSNSDAHRTLDERVTWLERRRR